MIDALPQFDLNLYISSDAYGSYKLTLHTDRGHFVYTLPVNQFDLYNISKDVKNTLGGIVESIEYSKGIDIASDICDSDLEKIADLNLFNRVFLGLDPSDEVIEWIDDIKRILERRSRIQIIADNNSFFIPWPLLYEKELSNQRNVDRESFWGFKHVIEQIPVTKKIWKFGADIDISSLQFGFNVNNTIDSSFNVSCVADQKIFFDGIKIPSFTYKMRTTEDEVLDSFSKNELEDKIVPTLKDRHPVEMFLLFYEHFIFS
jgi:hypothetical protein